MPASTPALNFEWSEHFELDRGPIDAQHRRLVLMVARLGHAVASGHSRESMEPIFEELCGYVRDHFTDEERLMRNSAFPGLETHVEEHERFGRTVAEFHKLHDMGATGVGWGIIVFLKNWVTRHILGADREFWQFVAAHPELGPSLKDGSLYG